MDRATWQEEWNNVWGEFERAHKELDSAMPSTQSSLPMHFESIDVDRVQRLKAALDEAWNRIVELRRSRPRD